MEKNYGLKVVDRKKLDMIFVNENIRKIEHSNLIDSV